MNWLRVRLATKPEARLQLINEAVAEGSDQAIKFLLTAVSDTDAGVRLAAVQALGTLQSAEAPETLAAGLADENLEIRKATVTALTQIGAPHAVPVLILALEDPNSEIRRQSAAALEKFKWRPETAEQRAAWCVARKEFAAAVNEGAAAIRPLSIALQEEQFFNRRDAAIALGKIHDSQVAPLLINAIEGANIQLRVAIAEALGTLGDPCGAQAITMLLADIDPLVRVAAAKAARKLADPMATEALIAALNDKSANLRKAAVEALGEIRDSRAVEVLLNSLRDSAHEVRQSVIEALGKLGDASAAAGLLPLLVDPQISIRQAADEALRNIAPDWESSPLAREALPVLKQALESKDYWVRHPAADLINRILRAQQMEAPPDIAPSLEYHNQIVAAMLECINDRDRDVRQAVVEALRRVVDSRAADALKLRLEDSDPWIRGAASRTLEALQPKKNSRLQMPAS